MLVQTLIAVFKEIGAHKIESLQVGSCHLKLFLRLVDDEKTRFIS